jgi:hypothetical protein
MVGVFLIYSRSAIHPQPDKTAAIHPQPDETPAIQTSIFTSMRLQVQAEGDEL